VRARSRAYNIDPEVSALYDKHFGAGATAPAADAGPASEGLPKVVARSEPGGGEPLDGAWLLPEGDGILKIDGSEWRHPDKGLASLLAGRQANDYEVIYQQHQGMKCEYRITKAADGKILFVEAADDTQPVDYCPSGKLLKAD
jgi:hypothetical protein